MRHTYDEWSMHLRCEMSQSEKKLDIVCEVCPIYHNTHAFFIIFLYMFNQKLWMFKSWSTCILIILLLWFTIFCWFLYESISDSWVSRYGGFYSHEDVREVVQYAQQRGITVIPEIDIPGHCYAAIQALPELSESVQKEGAPRSVKAGTCLLREAGPRELCESTFNCNSSSRDASCTSAWMKFLQKPGRTIRKKRREIGVSEELKKCVSS